VQRVGARRHVLDRKALLTEPFADEFGRVWIVLDDK